MDITYVPIDGGHMYPVAIIDVYSRYMVSCLSPTPWRLNGVGNALKQQ